MSKDVTAVPLSSGLLSVPRHVAFIMDGNGRWAAAKGLPRLEGHRAGAKTVRMVVEESRKLGIRYVTLYAFSSENWSRPADEVSGLMKLFSMYLKSELETLLKGGVRLRVMGQKEKLPASIQDLIATQEAKTADQTGMDLILAISYGARDEIVHAARELAKEAVAGKIAVGDICAAAFEKHLYLPDVPAPDLLVRTSNEFRISNFLLWQIAYSEIFVSPLHWPDFSLEEYQRALTEFGKRERRYGKTSAQLTSQQIISENSTNGSVTTSRPQPQVLRPS